MAVFFTQRVDTMGGLFTHEYLTSDTIVLGFEHGHTAFIDIRMPRAECWYAMQNICWFEWAEN